MAGVSATSSGFTELDSHANIGVVGKDVTVYEDTGRTVDVSNFMDSSPSVCGKKIVNAIMAHDDPYSGETIMCIAPGVMQVDEMNHNLLPPFLYEKQASMFAMSLCSTVTSQPRRIIVFSTRLPRLASGCHFGACSRVFKRGL